MTRGSSGRSPNHIVSVLNSPSISCSSSPEPQLASNMGRRNMRQSSQDDTMPVTYTPTTHRISKAKKGKRVHACQYPGCGKVFTRAEHRRRHELNHNPEASYRCATPGCKKAFHRVDLLARHMERHELESQPEQPWASNTQKPIVTESGVPRCMSMDHGMPLAATSHSHSMSIGSLVAPGIHPELANDCSLMWSGVDLPLQPRPAFHSQLPDSVDDSPFYSSPAETCPSPLSDATFSLPPHSSSSISSASVSVIDQYPKNILKGDVTSSPLQIHTPLRWDTDAGMPPSHLVPMSMGENMIQPPVQCHYPSPSWSSADCLPYEDQVHSMHQFQPVSWSM
ncbi:Zinc finger C2H2 [Penicillium cf. griseofulvum]|uniref:Zinc finger C2H2 n=1 Tax=Penicillium cf. griseofulvum TaxID=2972120 RepID=A0A9W9T285_9EURO|nr:Zinc finger C2H2 [Penicillium cf. griseofulvum]KAJ5440809.1 Zinc finger C2H2 [Penicillium cf. griseofulvum]KAJ5448855.1 Zinc finger C2H2 [Penicillium cf. griseofulvum]